MPGDLKPSFAILPALFIAATLSLAQAPVLSDEVKSPAAIAIPTTLLGTWRVTGVLVDTLTMRRLNIEHNDPGYLGHILLIAPDAVLGAIDPWGGVCVNPTVTVKPTTAAALIKDTMGGRSYAPGLTAQELAQLPPKAPTPQDYRLPYTANTPVAPMWIHCAKGDFGDESWLLMFPDGKLGIRWADASVLVFGRVTEPIQPIASFDCAKAGTPVEKTICSSMDLALLDQVDVRHYLNFIDIFKRRTRLDRDARYMDSAKDLRGVYRGWRARRETCGPDPACLKRMLLELWDILDKTEIPDFHGTEPK